MRAGTKFCTRCGSPNSLDQRFCSSCGACFEAVSPPAPPFDPASGSGILLPSDWIKNTQAPQTLPALFSMVVAGMVQNIRGTIKNVIKGMIISFALVLFLNTFLQVTSLRQTETAKSVIAAAGFSSSPDALFFWFLFTAILAFFWAQITSRGVRTTLGKLASLPRWLWCSLKTAGSTAFPLVMAGIAAALIVRLFLLSSVMGIQFLVLMFGILFSQAESLTVLALRLGYSDLNRMVRRRGPEIPAPGFPVMGVFGAFCGFLVVLFVADSLPVIAAAVVLMVAGSLVVWYRRRNAATFASPSAGAAGSGEKGS